MINKIEPYFTYRPQKGDIIIGEPEFNVGRKIGEKIEVGVTINDCVGEKKVIEQIWSKDKLFEMPHIYETDISCHDENRSKSCWLVIDTVLMESKEFLHGATPETYLVVAQKLKNDQVDPDGEVIHFYTCGKKVNKVEKKFEVVACVENI